MSRTSVDKSEEDPEQKSPDPQLSRPRAVRHAFFESDRDP